MKFKLLVLPLFFIFFAAPAFGEDVLIQIDIEETLNNPKVSNTVYEDIALYWGPEQHPSVDRDYGEFKTSKRTNKLGKSREKACQWAMASALKALQDRARKEGGNAIKNIRSNVNNKEVSSETTFECLCGSMMVNVALKGDVVKLAE